MDQIEKRGNTDRYMLGIKVGPDLTQEYEPPLSIFIVTHFLPDTVSFIFKVTNFLPVFFIFTITFMVFICLESFATNNFEWNTQISSISAQAMIWFEMLTPIRLIKAYWIYSIDAYMSLTMLVLHFALHFPCIKTNQHNSWLLLDPPQITNSVAAHFSSVVRCLHPKLHFAHKWWIMMDRHMTDLHPCN